MATQVFAGPGRPLVPAESPEPTVAASPSPTMDPAIRNALATALIVNQSLARRAEVLRAAIDADSPVAGDIAAVLRLVNSDLTAGNEAADRLLLSEETAVLGTDLGEFYDAIRARNAETLGTTIRNVDAYVAGGQAVLDLLVGLTSLDDRIADALARRPVASPSPSSATPAPPTTVPGTAAPTRTPPPISTPSPPAPPSTSLVPNGSFEDGLAGWQLLVTSPAEATVEAEAGAGPDRSVAARVDIQASSQARSGVSLAAAGLTLRQGGTYRVEIFARASVDREIRVRLTGGSGQPLASRVFTIGTTWDVITFDVTQLVTDSDVELGLDLGRSDATAWFDNVTVREAGG